jgi:hypothetical protein
MHRSFCLAAIVVGLGLGLTACSKSTPDTSSTTTNGQSLTTAPSATDTPPATPGAPGAPGAPGQRGPSHRMQAFLDSCNGKNANDACTVQLASRSLTGTCTQVPQGPNQGQLSCRPSPGQLGPHRGGMDVPGAASSAAPLRPGDPGYIPPPAHPPAAN